MEPKQIIVLAEGEKCGDFLARVLEGRVGESWLRIGTAILEIIVTELQERQFQLSAQLEDDGLAIRVEHGGRILGGIVFDSIRDFVDSVDYVHKNNKSHVLTIKKTFGK